MERALIAYLLGALLGAGGLVVESLVLGDPLRVASLAAYAFCGGLTAASTRALAELWVPGFGARVACLVALSAFVILHLAYFANVKVLPMEPYWTPRSVSLDLSSWPWSSTRPGGSCVRRALRSGACASVGSRR